MPDDELTIEEIEQLVLDQPASVAIPPQQQQRLATSTPGANPNPFRQFIQNQQGRRGLDLAFLWRTLWDSRSSSVVVWVSNGRFTYAALFANAQWFITGTGAFYGKNEFNHDEFVKDVLGHPEVTAIWVGYRFEQIYQR